MTMIRTMTSDDADAVLAIYQSGIDTGHATFESQAPDWTHFDDGKMPEPRLVALSGDKLVGWAALSPVSSRCVYGGVGEVTVYVDSTARGGGIGGALLDALIKASEAAGIWTLQSGIFVENTASIKIHEKHGFEHMGIRKALGKMSYGPMAGQWRDVLMMERRSSVVGVD
jgi:L-amino acid N-acyltransferase YncA